MTNCGTSGNFFSLSLLDDLSSFVPVIPDAATVSFAVVIKAGGNAYKQPRHGNYRVNGGAVPMLLCMSLVNSEAVPMLAFAKLRVRA